MRYTDANRGGDQMSRARDGSRWRHLIQYSFLKVFADDEMIDHTADPAGDYCND